MWGVGDGRKIKIWRHAYWIPKPISLKPVVSTRPCRLKWVHQLIDEDARSWNVEVLRRFFHHFDVEEILKIRLHTREVEDVIACHYERPGLFTVKSAYRLGVSLKDRPIHGLGLPVSGLFPTQPKAPFTSQKVCYSNRHIEFSDIYMEH